MQAALLLGFRYVVYQQIKYTLLKRNHAQDFGGKIIETGLYSGVLRKFGAVGFNGLRSAGFLQSCRVSARLPGLPLPGFAQQE